MIILKPIIARGRDCAMSHHHHHNMRAIQSDATAIGQVRSMALAKVRAPPPITSDDRLDEIMRVLDRIEKRLVDIEMSLSSKPIAPSAPVKHLHLERDSDMNLFY